MLGHFRAVTGVAKLELDLDDGTTPRPRGGANDEAADSESRAALELVPVESPRAASQKTLV